MADDNDLDTRALDRIMNAFKGEMPNLKVGILGDKNSRSDGKTNAEIGAKHEFGGDGMPIRSFMRMPINDKLEDEIEQSGLFGKNSINEVIKKGDVTPWMMKIGILCEKVIQDAFDSGGFGKWPKWKPGYKSNTGLILVNTQQLKRSIVSKVE
jgi:phage gpG-like protein